MKLILLAYAKRFAAGYRAQRHPGGRFRAHASLGWTIPDNLVQKNLNVWGHGMRYMAATSVMERLNDRRTR